MKSSRGTFQSLSLITALAIALVMSSIIARSEIASSRTSAVAPDEVVSFASGNAAVDAKVRTFTEALLRSTRGMKLVRSTKRTSVLDEVEDVVSSGDVELHLTDEEFPALHDAQVAELPNGQVLATIPIKGEEVVDPSNITAIFGADGELGSLHETLFRPAGPDSGRLTMWRDGKVVFDMMADSHGNSWAPSSAPAETSDQIMLANSQWWHFNKCLTQAGISQWAITLLGIACGIACAVTLGTGCILCLGAAGVVAGSTIGFCAGRAKQHLPR